MKKIIYILSMVILFIPHYSAASSITPPKIFRDEGACPGESCVYGEWQIIRNIYVHAKPDSKSSIIANLEVGELIEAKTGFVESIPGIFYVEKSHAKFNSGDSIYLYTYMGEGHFKAWFNGVFFEGDFSFSYWDKKKKNTWGYVSKAPKSQWWVKIKNSKGLEGWIEPSGKYCWGRYCK